MHIKSAYKLLQQTCAYRGGTTAAAIIEGADTKHRGKDSRGKGLQIEYLGGRGMLESDRCPDSPKPPLGLVLVCVVSNIWTN